MDIRLKTKMRTYTGLRKGILDVYVAKKQNEHQIRKECFVRTYIAEHFEELSARLASQ